ncbi:protein mono-ADP-ribosyltransferase PARP14-like [Saccostrea cucullata]|uniref:protein mono-ADP-ribosyltransferase PARP14-like n=1 Tax=Saccostrea cuccullata TaxID=36930 RepID=UPI002ED66961
MIARRAGPVMRKECKDYIQKHGTLPVSKAFLSGAGQLKFKKIIHVVGPSWLEYTNKLECLKDLARTVTNLLEKAKECKVRTVAIPTISSGIFRVPKSLCAAMYLKGVFDFSKQKKFGSLKELHIVDLSMEVLELVKEKYQHYLTFKQAIDPAWLVVRYHSEEETKTTQSKTTTSTQASKLSEKTQDKPNRGQASVSKPKENKNYEHPSMKSTKIGNVSVFIYTGDIGTLSDLDVAVSSENPHFTGKGGLAATFLSKGGKKYREEHEKLQKSAPYFLYSQVMTLGYDMSFKKICHAIIVGFSKTKPLLFHHHRHYTNFVCGILFEVNNLAGQSFGRKKSSIQSIVMPLLGAGNLRDPNTIQTLCSLTRDAIEWYARFKPSNITQIYLVNMQDDFTKMLEATFKQTSLKLPISGGNVKKTLKFDSRPFQYIYTWKVPSKDQSVSLADFVKQSENTQDNSCIICMDEMTKPVEFTRCHHQFCEECIVGYFSVKPVCPSVIPCTENFMEFNLPTEKLKFSRTRNHCLDSQKQRLSSSATNFRTGNKRNATQNQVNHILGHKDRLIFQTRRRAWKF